MVDAAPFQGLRYNAAVAGDPATTSAPAYDDVDRADYLRHRSRSPYTVLALLTEDADGGWASAAETYRRWRRNEVLVSDERPALYVYEEHELLRAGSGVRIQRGLLAALRVEPPRPGGAVVAHEAVDPVRVSARVARLHAVPVDLTPVFTVTTALPGSLRALLADVSRRAPTVDFVDDENVGHRLWTVADGGRVRVICDELRQVRLLIADGHHRYAAALAHGASLGARTLVYIVDADDHGPRVLPLHRLLRSLPPDWAQRWSPQLEAVGAAPQRLAQALASEPPGVVALRTRSGAWLLRPGDREALAAAFPAGASPAWRALDVALVDTVMLPRIGVRLRSTDVTDDPDIDLLEAGAEAVVLVRPVPAAAVQAIADRGERMPAKSTSFRPKPRSGLVMRALDD